MSVECYIQFTERGKAGRIVVGPFPSHRAANTWERTHLTTGVIVLQIAAARYTPVEQAITPEAYLRSKA